jgi:hypothetical protein
MAVLQYRDSSSTTDVITTGLNALTNNTTAVSLVMDNSTNLDLYADFELLVKYAGSTPSVGARIAELYVIPTIDGVNYAEGVSGAVDPQRTLLVGAFESRNPSTSAAERLIIPGISLPPRQFRVILKNTSGQTFASSDNTLKMRTYKLQNAPSTPVIPTQPITWKLIDEITTNSVYSNFSFTIDGNTNLDYQFFYRIIAPNFNNPDFLLTLNSDSTSFHYTNRVIVSNLTSMLEEVNRYTTGIFLGRTFTGSDILTGNITFSFAPSGYNRCMLGSAALIDSTGETKSMFNISSCWKNNSSNLTTINLAGTIGGQIGIGSRFEIWGRSR